MACCAPLLAGALLAWPAAARAQRTDSTRTRARVFPAIAQVRTAPRAFHLPQPDTLALAIAQPEPPEKPADEWKLSAEFSYTDQSGNKVLRLLTTGLNISHRDKDRYKLDLSMQSRYGQSDGAVVARNQFASLAMNLQPKAVWSPFLYANAERDVFRRLNLRFSGGAGAVFTPFPSHSDAASLSLALVDSYEDLRPTEADPTAPTRNLARWNVQLKGSKDLSTAVSVHHTSNFQPAVGELADYLLRTDTGLKVLLTEQLALSVDYQLTRNARPPEGVEADDRLLKTGLIIDF